jgi:formylglycine-generating enzyme required for sulfatase activity
MKSCVKHLSAIMLVFLILFVAGCGDCECPIGGFADSGGGTDNNGNNGNGGGGNNNGVTVPNLGKNGDGKDGDVMTINGIECVLVKAGKFIMGSPLSEEGRYDRETQHQVTLTKDFWISKYPITQGQYGISGDANYPATYIDWFHADEFAKSKGGRLPTEAEWEFAARGGNKSQGYIYSGSNNLDEVGWYYKNSGDIALNEEERDYEKERENNNRVHPVGEKKANELGIYDMSGNVWEWCSDWYGSYPTEAVINPTGPGFGDNRVLRGGSWNYNARYCRVADRDYDNPSDDGDNIGFRVAFPRN